MQSFHIDAYKGCTTYETTGQTRDDLRTIGIVRTHYLPDASPVYTTPHGTLFFAVLPPATDADMRHPCFAGQTLYAHMSHAGAVRYAKGKRVFRDVTGRFFHA